MHHKVKTKKIKLTLKAIIKPLKVTNFQVKDKYVNSSYQQMLCVVQKIKTYESLSDSFF